MVRFYVAVIERAEDGFSVFFTDVPGCTSAGDTLQEAARNAEQALHGHLTLALENDEPLPEALPLEAIPADPEVAEVARVLVRFEVPARSVRVNITLPEDLLAAVDQFAKGHGFTRSGLLAQAVREHIRADGA
jgi:predicted RNase H-like HicB family nuclease